jgi:nucleoside-diphosphate-sugar epimerase
LEQVLVTGASGFVGKILVERLVNDGFQVKVLTRSNKKSFPEAVNVIVADLLESSEVIDHAVIDCDLIFHCAGEVNDQDKMFALHVEGTRKLLDAVNKSFQVDGKSKHWLQLSSVGAYGSSLTPGVQRVVSELSKPKPIGVYEVTKTLADEMIIESSNNTEMTYTILRPSNIVGLSMPNHSFRGLLSAISNRRFFFIGTKKSISNYIHVDDVVDALVVSAINKKSKNQIFNLSNDCNLSEIVNSVSLSSGFKSNFLCLPESPLRLAVKIFSKIIRLPISESRIDSLVSQTSYPYAKIKDALGFSPKISIPEFAVSYLKSFDD